MGKQKKTERYGYIQAEYHGILQEESSLQEERLHYVVLEKEWYSENNIAKERDKLQFKSQLHYLKDIWPYKDYFIFLNINFLIFNMEIVLPAFLMSQSYEGLIS